jgi:hypothetical protein
MLPSMPLIKQGYKPFAFETMGNVKLLCYAAFTLHSIT